MAYNENPNNIQGGYNPNGYNQGYNPNGYNNGGMPPKPNNYLVFSILVTLFCCLPTGIAAIVYSSQTETAPIMPETTMRQSATPTRPRHGV